MSLRGAVRGSLHFMVCSLVVGCTDASPGALSNGTGEVTPASASGAGGSAQNTGGMAGAMSSLAGRGSDPTAGSDTGGAINRGGAGGVPAAVAGASMGGRTASEAGGQSSTNDPMSPRGGAPAQGGMAGVSLAGMGGAALAGMAGAAGAPALPAATFTDVYNKVFLNYCLNSGCHDNARKQPYFGTQQDTYAFFVQPNVIFPGENPNYSAIYDYIAWQIMPPDPNPKVPQEGVDIVAGWIAAGALDD
jgi:hypothetical protein